MPSQQPSPYKSLEKTVCHIYNFKYEISIIILWKCVISIDVSRPNKLCGIQF